MLSFTERYADTVAKVEATGSIFDHSDYSKCSTITKIILTILMFCLH